MQEKYIHYSKTLGYFCVEQFFGYALSERARLYKTSMPTQKIHEETDMLKIHRRLLNSMNFYSHYFEDSFYYKALIKFNNEFYEKNGMNQDEYSDFLSSHSEEEVNLHFSNQRVKFEQESFEHVGKLYLKNAKYITKNRYFETSLNFNLGDQGFKPIVFVETERVLQVEENGKIVEFKFSTLKTTSIKDGDQLTHIEPLLADMMIEKDFEREEDRVSLISPYVEPEPVNKEEAPKLERLDFRPFYESLLNSALEHNILRIL